MDGSAGETAFLRKLAQLDPAAAEMLAADPRAGEINAPPPAVDEAWGWVWRAWHRLSPERAWRPAGMGDAVPGRLPWTAIRAWASHHRMGEDDMALLDFLLSEMDDEFLAWHREQRSKDAGK